MSTDDREQRFAELHDRLTSLQDAMTQLRELIERLANFDFQPGSVPLAAGDDDDVSAELSTEIIQIIREQNEDLELLQEDITSHRPPKQHDKARLTDGVERLKGELGSCRASFRKAQMSAKRNRETAQRRERQLLLATLAASPKVRSGASSPASEHQQPQQQAPLRRRKNKRSDMTKNEQTVSAANDVTVALRRTHDMMAAELSRSDFAHTTLKESTAALAQLSDSYSSLDSVLTRSRDLLGTLLKSQKSDTWYLETAFYLLSATLCWLVYRRFLYGPMWWLIWLPVRTIFRSGVSVTNSVRHHGADKDVAGSAGVQPGVPTAEMNNKDVPTIRVMDHDQPKESPEPINPESMVDMIDQVERIIDESKDATLITERDDDEMPNLSKQILEAKEDSNPDERIFEGEAEEEAVVPQEPERLRDEL
ncbi:hypothetical protein PG996_000827 [Apiospora saccharicola]|uniref:Sec20 C-terminal domain-containing protein n=1 Tax=Apiospora saccharicola TaxID=335842 RepID=A0ABR1WEW5_9PEZI